MPSQQNTSNNLLAAVEERFFPIKLRGHEDLIQSALEEALGVSLDSLTRGFWVGRKDVNSSTWFEITVRALPVEGGTAIEVRLQPRWTPAWGWLYGLGIATGCILIVPLIWALWYAHRRNERIGRERLVTLHRAWTELGDAIGAPMRAPGYREPPKRIYESKRRQRVDGPQRVEEEPDAHDEAAVEAAESSDGSSTRA